MCGLVQKQYVPLMLLKIYRTAELLVNKVKDNIEVDSKEIELMTTWNESNLLNI
jgi:hypothetical protein